MVSIVIGKLSLEVRVTSCGHVFHRYCLDHWYRKWQERCHRKPEEAAEEADFDYHLDVEKYRTKISSSLRLCLGLPPIVEPEVTKLRRLNNFGNDFNPRFKEVTNRARLYYGKLGLDEAWPCPLCRVDLLQEDMYTGFGENAPIAMSTRVEDQNTIHMEKVLKIMDRTYELQTELDDIEAKMTVKCVTSQGIHSNSLLVKPGYQAFVRNYVGKLINAIMVFAEANGRGNKILTTSF